MRILLVSSTNSFKGRVSNISELHSRGDWLCLVGAAGSLGCETSLDFMDLIDLVTGAWLEPTLTLGADFAVLPFFPMFVTIYRSRFSVTGQGAGMGAGGVVPLTTWLPPTTWFQTGTSFTCSADDSPRVAWTAGGLDWPRPLLH